MPAFAIPIHLGHIRTIRLPQYGFPIGTGFPDLIWIIQQPCSASGYPSFRIFHDPAVPALRHVPSP
ncbi:hypothetical protein JKG41_07680 [Acidithiobacillus sp. MC2.1]|uniref:hypothetical protein n=1 Tax=Acidithiobacillus TaxID=119977 RepID=UPI0002D4E265|nr:MULTISPECIES: hypothetical protein [Acidithiobacillus]MBN6744942.1 hypothetical protein [Acidithiobacillus sp. MC2.2]MBN6747874.1 hypothetical protein [Acidithiobacillus sp. PG05]